MSGDENEKQTVPEDVRIAADMRRAGLDRLINIVQAELTQTVKSAGFFIMAWAGVPEHRPDYAQLQQQIARVMNAQRLLRDELEALVAILVRA